jgi:hypothetical protein
VFNDNDSCVPGGPQPAILQEVSIPVWSNSECKLKYGAAAPGGIVDSFLCAGRAAKDSCSVRICVSVNFYSHLAFNAMILLFRVRSVITTQSVAKR